ncbi:MAG: hypothetical protein PHS79_04190 [Patescibacteria group bacterium]|nr:hypothetical protein [Patescibacteria group bacterium]
MASSKFPIDFVDVSQTLIEFAKTDFRIHCNIRPWQKQPNSRPFLVHDGEIMDPSIIMYCKDFVQPHDFLLLHFQGYGEATGTAVIEIQHVYIGDGGYPRLDFEHPPEMKEIYGCPNFWGAFILAIARVPPGTPAMCMPDPDGGAFIRKATELLPDMTRR